LKGPRKQAGRSHRHDLARPRSELYWKPACGLQGGRASTTVAPMSQIMSPLAFLRFDTLASALWAGLFLAIGWVFASQIQQVLELLSTLGTVAIVVLVVVAAACLVLRAVKGFSPVRALTGGIDGWVASGPATAAPGT
jgi:hypothetical protein